MIGTSSDEPEYSYEAGPTGPENWGNLKIPEWLACGNGESQSPIHIYKKEQDIVKANLTLVFNYTSGEANVHLGNYDVGVRNLSLSLNNGFHYQGKTLP